MLSLSNSEIRNMEPELQQEVGRPLGVVRPVSLIALRHRSLKMGRCRSSTSPLKAIAVIKVGGMAPVYLLLQRGVIEHFRGGRVAMHGWGLGAVCLLEGAAIRRELMSSRIYRGPANICSRVAHRPQSTEKGQSLQKQHSMLCL